MKQKEENNIYIVGLTLVTTIIGTGQFVIQFLDPNLTAVQKGFAIVFAVFLAALFIVINIILLRKK